MNERFGMDNELARMEETKIGSELIYDGKIMHVYRDDIRLPDGGTGIREIMRHIGAVCIVPITDDGKIILEKQYRYAVGKVVIEIPAGKLDFADEVPLEAAKRELKEETGYTAENWQELGVFYSAIAYSDERITMFLATGLEKGEQHLDRGEFLDYYEVPLREAYESVMRGEIIDSKTQIGILKAVNIFGGYDII